MNCLLEVGLSNAAVATGLGVVALAVGRMWKNPALTHALWVLVLVKLVTPPLVSWEVVHLPEPQPAAVDFAAAELPLAGDEGSGELSQRLTMSVTQQQAQLSAEARFSAFGEEGDPEHLLMAAEAAGAGTGELAYDATHDASALGEYQLAEGGAAAAPSQGDVPPGTMTEHAASPWPLVLLCIWLAGSVAYLCMATSRFRLFQRLLASAKPAPARIRSRVERLAGRVGVPTPPNTWLIRAPITPLVWCGLRGTHLLLPTKLIRRLSDQQQATLLTHELAHLRRRDHWVRWLELAATALFWWHPVVWWARYEMREAEEQCCDAWVVWVLPQAARDYLTAVLETVDFLSEDAQPLPAPASGVGQFKHLQRRFARVLDGSPPKASGWWGKAFVLILAVVLLPLVPTIARQGADESTAAAQEPAKQQPVPDPADDSPQPPTVNPRITDPIRFETTPANLPAKPPKEGEAQEDALPVLLLAHAPDGSTLATVHVAQADDTPQQQVRIRDPKTGRLLRLLKGHDDLIRGMAYSPDGKTLATASYDKTVRLWDVATGKAKSTLKGHDRWAVTVAFSFDGKTLASGGYDRAICVWDVATGKRIARFQAHDAAVQSVAWSHDHKLLATGGSDRKIKLWDTTSWKLAGELTGHKNSVRAIAFSPKTLLLASGGADKELKFWDVEKRTEQATLFHTDVISALAFSPGGGTLATASFDRTVRTWNVATREPLQTLGGHTLAVTGVAFASDGSALFSAGLDNTIKRWPIAKPPIAPLAVIPRENLQVFALDISPDGKLLSSGGKDRLIHIRNAQTGELLKKLDGHGGGVLCTKFFSDNRRLASSSYDGNVRIWNVESGEVLAVHQAYTGERAFVRNLALSPDNKLLVAGNGAGVVMFWDLDAGKIIRTLPKEPLPVTDVAFSPDGKTVIVTSGNWQERQRPGRVAVWDVKTGKLLRTLQHLAEVRGAVFSPNGKRLVSFGPRDSKVWDTSTWRQIASLPGNIRAVAYLRDNQTVAVAELKGQMALVNAENGQVVARFQGHQSLVPAVVCSPAGNYLVSGCHHGWLKLWPTGQGDASDVVHGWGRRAQGQFGISFNRQKADHVAVKKLRYDGTHPLTLEAIVTPRPMKYGAVIGNYNDAGVGLHVGRDGKWMFVVHAGGRDRIARSDEVAAQGKTVHLVGVFDGKAVQLFVDGQLQKETDRVGIGAKVKPSGLPFYVGANPRRGGGTDAPFDGRIDAVRISKVARYTKDFKPPKAFGRDDKTLVLYHLAEGASNLVRDASGLGHHGQIIGGAWENLLDATAPPTLAAAAILKASDQDVWFARFSPDGKRLATGGADKIVKMWDAASRKLLWQATGHGSGLTCAAFSPDGKSLATGSWDRGIRLWDAATGKLQTTLEEHTGGLRDIVFSRDGKRMISCGEDKTVVLWNVDTQKVSKKLSHDLPVYSVALSPDGKLLATGTGNWKEKINGQIRLWDADSGKLVTALKGSGGLVTSLAFAPDGNTLVTADAGAGVAVWDIKKRTLVRGLWPDRHIRPIAISRDGLRIAAGVRSGTNCWARVWNARTGNLEFVLRGHEKLLFTTDFSPDGARLVTASGDGTVRFWDLGKSRGAGLQPAIR